MQIINPATEQVIKEVKEDSAESLSRKHEQLRDGQVKWQSVSLEQRIDVMRRFSSLLERDIEALAAILTSEVGKPIQQSRNEVNGARSRIGWMTDNAKKYLSDEVMTLDGNLEERISYEPLGVVGNISAWNYPYLVGVNVFAPALIAGNSVLYKPSEFATLTGLEIQRLLYEAGVPKNVFDVAIGGRETGETMLDLPLDGYFFTGSYKTGKYIYERVSKKMVPCQCELGGKDPLYVADDIENISTVAVATADGAFYNNGQSCCAVERIYVHEKIYDEYVKEFVDEVKRWKTGRPEEPGVYIGPLTRKDQLNVLSDQIGQAVQQGATVLTGGKPVQQKGFYFEPTVLINVNHSMTIMTEESFGPVIGIMKVKNDDEAVQLMNDTAYGLTAAVYSRSLERARIILSRINAGTGYWNCCDRVSAAVPWSGRKNSGFGSTLSHIGLRAFTRPKAYHLRSA
jgi:acyl-CoA reductase-like NAD-dependent aldehyde dehydrogenase